MLRTKKSYMAIKHKHVTYGATQKYIKITHCELLLFPNIY